MIRRSQILACLGTFGALLLSSLPVLAQNCGCPKPEITISAIPAVSEHVVAVTLTDPPDPLNPGAPQVSRLVTSRDRPQLERHKEYKLSIEMTGDNISQVGEMVELTFPHCSMEFRRGEDGEWEPGSRAAIKVKYQKPDPNNPEPYDPEARNITYEPKSIYIRITGGATDSQNGAGGPSAGGGSGGGGGSAGSNSHGRYGESPGNQATMQGAPAKYQINPALVVLGQPEPPPELVPPGMGIEIPLGMVGTEEGYRSAGLLVSYGSVGDFSAEPSNFRYVGIPEVDSEVIRQVSQIGGVPQITTVTTPQGRLHILGWDSATGQEVPLEEADETLIKVFAPNESQPHSFYRLENVGGGVKLVQSNYGRVSTKIIEATSHTLRETENSQVTETTAIPPAQGETDWQRQTTVTRDGVVISSNLKTFENNSGYYYLTTEVEDPDGDGLTTQTEYEPDGRVRSVSRPDGSWVRYAYDGYQTTTYTPWLSSSYGDYIAGAGLAVKTVSWESSDGNLDNPAIVNLFDVWMNPPDARVSTSYSESYLSNISGTDQLLSRTTRMSSDDNEFVRTTQRQTGGPNGDIMSWSLAYSHQHDDRRLAGRLIMTWDSTGRATRYFFEKGDWSGSAFTPNAGGQFVRSSQAAGHINNPSGASTTGHFSYVAGHATYEATITAPWGVIREEGYKGAKDFEYESSGQRRPTGVKANGFYVSRTEYVSPLITRHWSEDGSMTETEINADGETIRTTTSGNATVPPVTTLSNTVGLTTTTTVNGQTVSTEIQDLMGRTVSSQDATGATVITSYSPADGGRTVTRTGPGGVTTMETRHADGKAISTTGNGVIPRFYGYPSAYQVTTAVGSANSPRVSSTTRHTDGSMAGESHPDPENPAALIWTYYNYAANSSDLVRVHSTAANTADQVRINPASSPAALIGRYSLSGLETNGDGPVAASNDRLKSSSTSYETIGGIPYQKTITQAYHTNGSDASYTRTTLEALAPVAISHPQYGDGHRWTSSTSNGTTTVTTHRDCFSGSAATVTTTDDSATSVSPDTTSVSLHGQTVSSSAYGATAAETMAYDASGRMILHTSATGAKTTYGYNSAGQLETTTDHEGKTTTSLYHPNNHQNAGLLWKTINPKGEVTETLYNTRSQVIETTGNGTYRVTHGYNAYGEMDTMRTYQTSGSAGDLTQWNYNPATGLLDDKTDAAGNKTLYTYHSNGRLKSRTWARPGTVKTTYTYNAFGDLTFTDYSDTTPDVTVVHDRLGRSASITDASGTRTQAYHSVTGGLDLVAYGSGSLLPSLQIDYTQDGSLRPSGYSVSGGGPSSVIAYDTAGRLHTVTASGSTHTHGYIPGTGTLANLTTTSGSSTILTRTLYHDRMQRLRGTVTKNASGTPLSSHGYTLDDAGRRKSATRENGQRWDYGYDSLGQVTSAVKRFPNESSIPGHIFSYAFDGIGNRTNATHGGTDTDVTYTPNALNQYTNITTEGGRFILGEAPAANAVTVNGTTAARAGGLGFYWKQITGNNSASPLWSNDSVVSNSVTISGKTWTPKASVSLTHDEDGNLTSDGRWNYSWNAENRKTRMETTAIAATAGVPRQRLDFVYDSQGRRISKTVSTSTDGTTWTYASNTRFLYDGWNLIAEYSAPSATSTSLTLQASHAWGIDLSGTPQGAGGIGGLLCTSLNSQPSTLNCYPAFDGNGNISAWIDDTGTLLARMDYSPFGQLIAQYKFTAAGDTRLSRLAFGFSTKYTDSESGLLYYGYRYYDPVTGRWTNKDPIEERGGVNLYGFVGNDPVNSLDALGLVTITVTIERTLRSVYQVYGKGTITSDDPAVNKCCNMPQNFKTIELAPETNMGDRKGRPTRGGSNPEYYRTDASDPAEGGATRPSAVMGGYVPANPGDINPLDFETALGKEFNIQGSAGENMHSGSNATSSRGCIIMGKCFQPTKYQKYVPAGTKPGEYDVPGFSPVDSQLTYIRFLAAIACVERVKGTRPTFKVKLGPVPKEIAPGTPNSLGEYYEWLTDLNK